MAALLLLSRDVRPTLGFFRCAVLELSSRLQITAPRKKRSKPAALCPWEATPFCFFRILFDRSVPVV